MKNLTYGKYKTEKYIRMIIQFKVHVKTPTQSVFCLLVSPRTCIEINFAVLWNSIKKIWGLDKRTVEKVTVVEMNCILKMILPMLSHIENEI